MSQINLDDTVDLAIGFGFLRLDNVEIFLNS